MSLFAILLSFAAGAGTACLGVYLWLSRHAVAVAAMTRVVESGDLSCTVPERGPRAQRLMARVINAMAADFQEILLLFAHYVRSLKGASRPGTDTDLRDVAEILVEMEKVLHDFKYFRVRIENGAITDVGVGETVPKGDPATPAAGPISEPSLERRAET